MSRIISTLKLITLGLENLKDPIYRNAFYLILASAFGGLSGFTLWLIVEWLYTSDALRLAASMIALAGLLGSFSTLGLGVG